MCTEAYGEIISHVHMFEWYKRFSEGCEKVEDIEHCGLKNPLLEQKEI